MEIDTSILKTICECFAIAPGNAQLIRSYKNLVFDCGDKILRLTKSQIRTEHDIEVELDWLQYLGKNGLSVVTIVPSKKGNSWEKVFQKEKDRYFIAVCFEKINGVKISKATWNKNHFQKLGVLVGQLHKIGNGYITKPNLNYKHWDEIMEQENRSYLPQDDRALPLLYDQLFSEFQSYEINKFNYGLVHYDIHPGNYLLVEEGKIVLFDFEMSCKSWYLNEAAIVLYYACQIQNPNNLEEFETTFLKHFWNGYEKEYQIDEYEKNRIPKFTLFRDLFVFGYSKKIWKGRPLTEKEKLYQSRMEETIRQRRNKLEM